MIDPHHGRPLTENSASFLGRRTLLIKDKFFLICHRYTTWAVLHKKF